MDFSPDSKFVRTFGKNHAGKDGKVEVGFFDLTGEPVNRGHCGVRIAEVEELKAAFAPMGGGFEWASTSSAGAPEARGVTGSSGGTLEVASSVCRSPSNNVLCSGYADGSVRFQRYPAYSAASASAVTASLHSSGPVLTAFTAAGDGAMRVVSVGEMDGTVMVWKIDA